jgi:hypothetical protein
MFRILVFAKAPRKEEENKGKKSLTLDMDKKQIMGLNEVRFHRVNKSEDFKAEKDLVWSPVFQRSIHDAILAWQSPLFVAPPHLPLRR